MFADSDDSDEDSDDVVDKLDNLKIQGNNLLELNITI